MHTWKSAVTAMTSLTLAIKFLVQSQECIEIHDAKLMTSFIVCSRYRGAGGTVVKSRAAFTNQQAQLKHVIENNENDDKS